MSIWSDPVPAIGITCSPVAIISSTEPSIACKSMNWFRIICNFPLDVVSCCLVRLCFLFLVVTVSGCIASHWALTSLFQNTHTHPHTLTHIHTLKHTHSNTCTQTHSLLHTHTHLLRSIKYRVTKNGCGSNTDIKYRSFKKRLDRLYEGRFYTTFKAFYYISERLRTIIKRPHYSPRKHLPK